jgi:hypothetical protein
MKPQTPSELVLQAEKLHNRKRTLDKSFKRLFDDAYDVIEQTVGAKRFDYVKWDGLLFQFTDVVFQYEEMHVAVFCAEAPFYSRDRYIPIEKITNYEWVKRDE